LVAIHPFPNGNGRFSRMVGDLFAQQLGQPRFSWGSANLVDPNETRQAYVAALRAADAHDFDALIAFARS
jgi:Fic family protein